MAELFTSIASPTLCEKTSGIGLPVLQMRDLRSVKKLAQGHVGRWTSGLELIYLNAECLFSLIVCKLW